jgi:hypothetical protein
VRRRLRAVTATRLGCEFGVRAVPIKMRLPYLPQAEASSPVEPAEIILPVQAADRSSARAFLRVRSMSSEEMASLFRGLSVRSACRLAFLCVVVGRPATAGIAVEPVRLIVEGLRSRSSGWLVKGSSSALKSRRRGRAKLIRVVIPGSCGRPSTTRHGVGQWLSETGSRPIREGYRYGQVPRGGGGRDVGHGHGRMFVFALVSLPL